MTCLLGWWGPTRKGRSSRDCMAQKPGGTRPHQYLGLNQCSKEQNSGGTRPHQYLVLSSAV